MKTFHRHYLSLSRFALAALLIAAAGSTLHAGLVATDGSVTRSMDAGGTDGNPAEYILGITQGYSKTLTGNTIVGENNPYNSLTLQSGAMINSGPVTLGWSAGSDYNTVTVTGASSWAFSDGSLNLGNAASHNRMTVEDGSTIESFDIRINVSSTASDNHLTINGLGSQATTTRIYLGMEAGTTGSSITLENGGLLKLTESGVWGLSVGEENYLKFDGGYFAWAGEKDASWFGSFLDSGSFLYKMGNEWMTVDSAHLALRYFATDADGLAAIGIDGLGGYTVIDAIPEPGSFALLGVAAAGLALRRRFKGGKAA